MKKILKLLLGLSIIVLGVGLITNWICLSFLSCNLLKNPGESAKIEYRNNVSGMLPLELDTC